MFIWLRGSLPRLRYDQFMAFGWKVLIPVSLVWIVLVATVRVIDNEAGLDRNQLIVITGIVLAVFLAVSFLPERKQSAAGPAESELSAYRPEVDDPSGASLDRTSDG